MLGFILCWTIPGWMLELDIPRVCLPHCFPLCNETKILKYPWDLEVAKMGLSEAGDRLISFFSPLEKVCCLWNVGKTVRNMAGKVCEKLLEFWELLGALKRSFLQETFGILLVFWKKIKAV